MVLLHGYQGSWGLWQSTMGLLSDAFRTYAVDFWGFGEFGPRRHSYAIDDFVDLVDQFMQHMGIARAPLVGHSMGGTVALLAAARQPQRVTGVVAISAPVVGTSLHFFPRVFGRRAVGRLMYRNLWLYQRLYRALGPRYSRDPHWADMMDRDVSQVKLEAFFSSIGSLRKADIRGALREIVVQVLGMYGDRDNIVDPRQAELLQGMSPPAVVQRFPNCGHFIMLDEPQGFMQTLRSFLDERATQ